MGVDLTLCPERYPNNSWWLCFERFRLDMRNHDLWNRLQEQATPLNCEVDWYGDEGIETRSDDQYGEPLKFLTASNLECTLAGVSQDEWSDWDKAVYAFIKALPPQTRVLLWWS